MKAQAMLVVSGETFPLRKPQPPQQKLRRIDLQSCSVLQESLLRTRYLFMATKYKLDTEM
jgi:hypothetical protein